MSLELPGFAEPVEQAQACFRAVLEALSRPGRILSVAAATPPAPLAPATAAVLLTLLDQDTPIWLAPEFAAAGEWLAFHCGVRPDELGRAQFVIAREMPPLAALERGEDAAPERSATLVLQVAELGAGTQYRLSGPGLREAEVLSVRGLPQDFIAQWRDNHARFPCGVDVILCAGERLAALPRSVKVA